MILFEGHSGKAGGTSVRTSMAEDHRFSLHRHSCFWTDVWPWLLDVPVPPTWVELLQFQFLGPPGSRYAYRNLSDETTGNTPWYGVRTLRNCPPVTNHGYS